MILSYVTLLLLIVSIVGAIWLHFSSKSKPLLTSDSAWITKKELGELEEKLWKCKEVILVADKVEVPTRDSAKEILIAIVDNFIDGVEYNFLVPEEYFAEYSKFINERYAHIIDLASDFSDTEVNKSLFKLHSYPYIKVEADYPYLFYRFETESGDDEILAFRGEDIGEGISEEYRRMEPELARSFLLRALPYIYGEELTLIPSERYERFASSDDVIPFDKNRKKIQESAL